MHRKKKLFIVKEIILNIVLAKTSNAAYLPKKTKTRTIMYYQSTMTTKILLLLTLLKVAVGDDAEFSQMELAIQPIRMLQSSIPCSAVKSMLEQNSVIPANTCECTHLGDVTQAGFQHYKISCQDFCHIGSMSMEVEYHFQIQGMTGRIIESKEVFELNGSTVEKTQNFLFEDGSFQSCDIVAGSPW